MICTQCQTENDEGRKFCLECGARLSAGCPQCGASNPESAKFCGECGTALRSTAPRAAEQRSADGPPAPSAERRLVTVVFADLVGFTSLAADRDAEDTREFLTRYFELARTIVSRYGGTIEKFIGDAVMAVWGAPTAHEDDAERAVRAALEIVGAVPALSEEVSVQARSGVLTGEAAVTLGATGQGMVAGDLVNTASRLQSVASPGSVLVGEATYRAAAGSVSFEEIAEQHLKGKDVPVAAWRAKSVVALRRGSGRSAALEPPFVGRGEELRLLKELFHATERERKPRLVSVIGQPGIGKSRLAWEFEKYIDGVLGDVFWHAGRSPAYGEAISYWALAEMVRGRAGIAETDDQALAHARLAESVAEWISDEGDRRWIEPRLAGLLGLMPMPGGSRDELFAAWRTFFERIADRGPLVMVFGDLHWADDGLIDFIEELLNSSRNSPILVIALARPELLERRPGWGQKVRSFTAMGLEPLHREQIAEMVLGVVPGIPEDVLGAIVDRAEGVPLYAVETVRMLIDRGQLRPTADGRYEAAGQVERLAVPETLHALIAARLDALEPEQRRLIQTAAVTGQSFTLEAVAAVAGDSPDRVREMLAALVSRQLLLVEADPRSPERGQYQFVQGVVKEVAEQSLARADRRALHLAAARYYESLGDDELAGVLASHYVDAYRATPAGPEAEALAAQARVSLRGAADRAAALHSYVQVLGYVEQALAVTPDPTEQAALHERAVLAGEHLGLIESGFEHSRAAEALYASVGSRLGVLRAVTLRARIHLAQHGERPAIAELLEALSAVRDLDTSADVVRAQNQLARAYMIGAAYDEAVRWSNRVLASAGIVPDDELVEVLVTKGTSLIGSAGTEAEVLLRGAIDVSERMGQIGTSLRARNNLLGLLQTGPASELRTILQEGYALATRFGLRTWAIQFAHSGLTASFESGDWDGWLEESEAHEPTGFYLGWRLAELARRAAFRGDLDGAKELDGQLRDLIGEDSSQGEAGIAETKAGLHVAACEWDSVIVEARRAIGHADAALAGTVWTITAGAATGSAEWIAEAATLLDQNPWHGPLIDAMRAYARTAAAIVEARWTDARTHFAVATQKFDETGTGLWHGLMNLTVGTLAAGRFGEADRAAAAADEFFESVGARAFVERYRSSVKPVAADPRRVAPLESMPARTPATGSG